MRIVGEGELQQFYQPYTHSSNLTSRAPPNNTIFSPLSKCFQIIEFIVSQSFCYVYILSHSGFCLLFPTLLLRAIWKCLLSPLSIIHSSHTPMCALIFSILFSLFRQNQVSWIRRRDWHILSSGDILYTNDARFTATHEPSKGTFTLTIKFVQKRDHGEYCCQVSRLA